jgi:hypothetical protein
MQKHPAERVTLSDRQLVKETLVRGLRLRVNGPGLARG